MDVKKSYDIGTRLRFCQSTLRPGTNIKDIFWMPFVFWHNKLECLPRAKFFKPSLMFPVESEVEVLVFDVVGLSFLWKYLAQKQDSDKHSSLFLL